MIASSPTGLIIRPEGQTEHLFWGPSVRIRPRCGHDPEGGPLVKRRGVIQQKAPATGGRGRGSGSLRHFARPGGIPEAVPIRPAAPDRFNRKTIPGSDELGWS